MIFKVVLWFGRAILQRFCSQFVSALLQNRARTLQITVANKQIDISRDSVRHVAVSGCAEDYSFEGHHIDARLFECAQHLEQLFRIGHAMKRISFEFSPGAIVYIRRNETCALCEAAIECG